METSIILTLSCDPLLSRGSTVLPFFFFFFENNKINEYNLLLPALSVLYLILNSSIEKHNLF